MLLSLSARRAWIEIHVVLVVPSGCWVALRKESVDRNICMKEVLPWVLPSLSARRAWIEILWPSRLRENPVVALRKESVDRNTF